MFIWIVGKLKRPTGIQSLFYSFYSPYRWLDSSRSAMAKAAATTKHKTTARTGTLSKTSATIGKSMI